MVLLNLLQMFSTLLFYSVATYDLIEECDEEEVVVLGEAG